MADADRRGADAVWNTGDWVGYNAFPDEVVRLLRSRTETSISGNYDLKVLAFPAKAEKWRASKHPLKYDSFRWSHEALSDSSREYLASLPTELRFREGGRTILICHGSPVSVEEHLYPHTPIERFRELAIEADADIVVFGHSHIPFDLRAGDSWFINPGSVGRSDDGDPRASYALLDLGGEEGLQHLRVKYPVARSAQEIEERGLPPEFAEMIRKGRNLNWVLEAGAAIDSSTGETG